jgi:hypothetical protein
MAILILLDAFDVITRWEDARWQAHEVVVYKTHISSKETHH